MELIMKLNKITACILSVSLMFPVFTSAAHIQKFAKADNTESGNSMKLWYDEPAPTGYDNLAEWPGKETGNDDGWEKWALPIGNGYMGAMVFGRYDTERIQITENSMFNPYRSDASGRGGLNNFAEIYIDFNHTKVSGYTRELNLENAVETVSYTTGGTTYTREYLTSYPDKVLAVHLSASESGKISFKLHPEIPYIKDYGGKAGDNQGKSGTVTADGDTITLSGQMDYYQIQYEGQIKVLNNGGTITAGSENGNGTISVENADDVTILMAAGTNYQLESRVFTEPDRTKKLEGYPHPHEKVSGYINDAANYSYAEIKERHIEDYSEYFNRVSLDLSGTYQNDKTTDILVSDYKKNADDRYLEALFFQYGRYLLIASSREGCLPSTLQGIWNRYDSSPWTSGYWHNINVQMNYWPAFSTNLAEMFKSYSDYNQAYIASAENGATKYIDEYFPGKSGLDGGNGWGIGTGGWPFSIEAPPTKGHSGPGTSALTSTLFWDYYDFTRDENILKNITYPVVSGVSRFLSKAVEPHDGLYLTEYSASPEQMKNGVHYRTTGTTFDQQMTYESHKQTKQAADILGYTSTDDSLLNTIDEQIDKLDPVPVGKSGHVKEYREENYYGEIGEKNHRHVSQLVGLYPGTTISSNTPAWLDAAKVTLKNRGLGTTGWSCSHRQNLWARAKDGEQAYANLKQQLKTKTLPNLWDTHPPFQIDGNFGATAGISEMLLQSHEGYIEPIPAIPSKWSDGSYSGLVARGNFVVDASWHNSKVDSMSIVSRSGGKCKIKYTGIDSADIKDSLNNTVNYTVENTDIISFDTTEGETYTISDIPQYQSVNTPSNINVSYSDETHATVSWNTVSGASEYRIYRAVESSPVYELLGTSTTNTFSFETSAELGKKQTTYKVTAIDENGRESDGALKLLLKSNAWNSIGTVLFDEDYTSNKLSQPELEKNHWSETSPFDGRSGFESPEYGNFTAESGQLVINKTSDTSTPSNAGSDKNVYEAYKHFAHIAKNHDGNSRVTLRKYNFKGKYALDIRGAFTQTSGSSWIDILGYRDSANRSVGRFTINGSNGIFNIYNNKLNTSSAYVPMWNGSSAINDIRIVFDSESSSFQIFKNGSDTPAKTTAAVNNGASADTFSMTNWGVAPAGKTYISGIRFAINKDSSSGSFIKLEKIRLQEIEAAPIPAVDENINAITIDKLTPNPSAVISDITLPESVSENAEVTWSSSNTSIITNDGKVILPDTKTDVILTAKITNKSDGFTVYKDFRLTVGKPDDIEVTSIVFNDDKSITAAISKTGGNILQCTAIAAVYNNDILAECDIKPIKFEQENNTQSINTTFNISASPADTIKIFIFDSLEHMSPLSGVYTP